MGLRKPIFCRLSKVVLKRNAVCLFLLWTASFAAFTTSAHAKEPPAAGIVLFDGPKGAAYVQMTGIALNGKTEVRICDGVAKIDKKTYDVLPRAQLAGATSLERGSDGVLTLTSQSKPVCVVPSNLKFDKNPEFTPAEAAEQALLQGVPVSASLPGLAAPELKPGVRLVFVPAPDSDLAEYLRAQRANSIPDWQDFLLHFPTSTHLADARSGLAELHQHAAETAFAEYQKLAAAHNPDIALLKQAGTEAHAAREAIPEYGPAAKLVETIGQQLDMLLEADRAELRSYRDALQNHAAGYSHLAAAKRHVQQLLEVRNDYAPVLNLRRDVIGEEDTLGSTLAHAESLARTGRYDEALSALEPYRGFAPEVARIDAVLTSIYTYHLNQGREQAAHQSWEPAAAEFRKALAIRGQDPEANAALQNAMAQAALVRNQTAANMAVLQSNAYAEKGDFIAAYDTLAELPDAQQALVKVQLSALTRDYLTAASRRAQKLQETHIPIRSRADADAVRQACDLLDRAGGLSRDPALKLKHDFLAGKVSTYYIAEAKRYFDKPLGSGAAIGWLYLREAQHYDANLDLVKDQLRDLNASYAPIYQRRARLSIGIVIRDQTSRSNSSGFADQMTDAIATGLESLGVANIVRQPPEAADPMQPNFILLGEILEHRVVKNTGLETLPSKYRAGTHEIKSPAWVQASNDYEATKQQLADLQRSLAEAQAQHKKKEVIAAANDAVKQAQQNVDDLKHKLDTTVQTAVEAIVESYRYTKKTIDLTGSIELSFRISDRSGSVIEPPASVRKDNRKSTSVLENVKPEDTEGITNQGVEPDETQFLTDLEIEARNTLVKAVREKTAGLPAKILQEARTRAQHGDMDGAGEEYVLYLNATPDEPSPERAEAAKFLRDQFNLTVSGAAKP